MREFKFRVWQKDALDNGPYMVHPGHVADWQVKELNEGGAINVMQFTGLIDMKGKEVYEGDILKITNPFTKNTSTKKVWWNGETARFNGIPTSLVNVYEIIGNIHETPPLLNERGEV